jgi:hypothetical protein
MSRSSGWRRFLQPFLGLALVVGTYVLLYVVISRGGVVVVNPLAIAIVSCAFGGFAFVAIQLVIADRRRGDHH